MTVVLVLVSAFLHAAWNALLKREADKDRTLIAAVGFGTVLAIAVALGRGGPAFASVAALIWALVAGAFEQVYFLTLTRALDRAPLGPVYTISRGGAVAVVYPFSVLLFAERVTTASLVGSGIVVLGVVLSGVRSDAKKVTASGIAWAVACAFAIAAYHLAYKAALDAGGQSSAVFAASLTFATLINVIRTDRRAVAKLVRAHFWKYAFMGLLCGGSFLMLIEALATGGAGYALTLRNTSVLFAVLLAWMIGERPRVATALGALLVAAGAIVMTL